MDTPRVFISYSWTTPEFEQWVLDFCAIRHTKMF